MTRERIMNERLSRMPIEDLLNWPAVTPQARNVINAAIVQKIERSLERDNLSLVETLLLNSEKRINPQCAYEDASMLLTLALKLQGKEKKEFATECAVLAKRNIEVMPDSFKKVEMYLYSQSNGLELAGDEDSSKEYPKKAFDILKRLNETGPNNYSGQRDEAKPDKRFSELCLLCASSLMEGKRVDTNAVMDCVGMAEEATIKELALIKTEKDYHEIDSIKFDFELFAMNKSKILLSLGDVRGFLSFYYSAVQIRDEYNIMGRNFRDGFVRALGSFVPKIEINPNQLDNINWLLIKIVNPDDSAYGEFEDYFRLLTDIINRISHVSIIESANAFLTLDEIFKEHHTYYGEKAYKDWQRNTRDLLIEMLPEKEEFGDLRGRLNKVIEYNS